MEANATTQRTRAAAASAPKGKNAPAQADPNTIGQILDVDLKPLIAPAIILLVMCLPVGFIAMFNMRINGQFTYFNKTRLDMVDKRKEYKYVAKGNSEEDDEDELKPRTTALDVKEAALAGAVCALLGAVGGMLYGSLSGEGILPGITIGAACGAVLCNTIGGFMLIGAAFTESAMWGLIYLFVPFGQIVYIVKFWNEARRGFFTCIIGGSVGLAVFLLCFAVSVAMGVGNTQSPPQAMPPGGMQAPAVVAPAT